jgi:Cys-tRNA(Pro) deacylase
MTPAIRFLKQVKASFDAHLYRYQEKGGTRASATALGADEHAVIKTLVMEDGGGVPLIVLMHGDMKVSTRQLARQIGKKTIQPCKPAVAQKHTGYQVGGTSPFGTQNVLSIYMESTIATLPQLYINGGKRGFLVSMSGELLVQLLSPISVDVGIGPDLS